jgi:replicative DNA helicase
VRRNHTAEDGNPVGSVTSLPVVDEAEMAVLGAVLLSGTCALPAIVEEGVQCGDFRLGQRSVIFAEMVLMHEAGDSIDRVTLADWLDRAGILEDVGGRFEIDSLAMTVPNVGNLRQYARIVVRASMWRTRASILIAAGEAVETKDEDAYRRALGRMRETELRFRPLLERDLTTP